MAAAHAIHEGFPGDRIHHPTITDRYFDLRRTEDDRVARVASSRKSMSEADPDPCKRRAMLGNEIGRPNREV